jgi:signal peptide peptidase SppA
MTNELWHIKQSTLESMMKVQLSEESMKAISAMQTSQKQKVKSSGSIAQIDIVGPIFRYDSWIVRYFGGTSQDVIRAELNAALSNPDIKGILFNSDSPGGLVSGTGETADLIYRARSKKPMIAYVQNVAASAAYWLVCAVPEIVSNESAFIGSIGTVATFTDYSEAEKKAGIQSIEIVSSQSPMKRTDVKSSEGKAQIQTQVDDLTDLFISAIAKNRATSIENVKNSYGRGDVLIASKAKMAGMIDHVGNYDYAMSSLLNKISYNFKK